MAGDRFFVYGVRADIRVTRSSEIVKALTDYVKTYLVNIYGISEQNVKEVKMSYKVLSDGRMKRTTSSRGTRPGKMSAYFSAVNKSAKELAGQKARVALERSKNAIPMDEVLVMSFEIKYDLGNWTVVDTVDFLVEHNPKMKTMTVMAMPSIAIEGIDLEIAKQDIVNNKREIQSGGRRPE